MKTFVFGHKNPDTDSICAAVAYAHLKNQLGESCEPRRLGEIQKETQFVLDRFDVPAPDYLDNVKIQVRDLKYTRVNPIKPEDSILHAYHEMEEKQLKTMAIADDKMNLLGLVTMKDIAMEMITGDLYRIDTTVRNIIEGLGARKLTPVPDAQRIRGTVGVFAYYVTTAEENYLTRDMVVIVGDRYDAIEAAITSQVQMVIVTGNFDIPERLVDLAAEHNVPLLSVPKDTYTVSKLIQQCNFISTVMEKESLIQFYDTDYLEEIRDDIIRNNYRNFPVISPEGQFLGFMGRKHLLRPGKKSVIMVDHNEFGQSAEGIQEANILEILDHHKLGGLATSLPISFINMPVGSSCTIIYNQYLMNQVPIQPPIAGLLISGILSDTLHFKSPTSTPKDVEAVRALNKILGLSLDNYFMEMFRAGTSIEGYTEEEILQRDFKEFVIGGYKVGISQIFTLDIEAVRHRQTAFLESMKAIKRKLGYQMIFFVVTDIVQEGSFFFYDGEIQGSISGAFQGEDVQGAFCALCCFQKEANCTFINGICRITAKLVNLKCCRVT